METRDSMVLGGVFHVRCIGPDGRVKWEDEARNTVTNVGLQHALDVVFSGSSQVDPWYIGLIATSTPTVAAGDTLGTHAGWTEFTDYADNRKAWVEVRSSQTMTNTASKASFSVNQDASTIGGCFLCSVATTTTGTLMSGAAFSGGDKSADNGDTLEVTYQFTAASA